MTKGNYHNLGRPSYFLNGILILPGYSAPGSIIFYDSHKIKTFFPSDQEDTDLVFVGIRNINDFIRFKAVNQNPPDEILMSALDYSFRYQMARGNIIIPGRFKPLVQFTLEQGVYDASEERE